MRRALLAVLAVGAALAIAPGAVAAPSGGCGPYADPRISLSLSKDIVQAGTVVSAGGYVTRSSCPVAGAVVALVARDRPGAFHYIGQSTTDARGAWQVRRRMTGSLDVMAVFAAPPAYARTLSRISHIHVQREPVAPTPPDTHPQCAAWLPPRNLYQPPAGVTLTLELDATQLPSGESVTGRLVLDNGSDSQFRYRLDQAGDLPVVLRNTRNGEVPSWYRYAFNSVRGAFAVGAGSSQSFGVQVQSTYCQYGRSGLAIHPDTFEAVGGLEIRDYETRASLGWLLAPPVPVTVTGTPR